MNETHVLDGHTGVEHSLPVPRIYKDVDPAVREEQVGLHADADRRLRRAVAASTTGISTPTSGRTSSCCASRRARSSTRGRGGGRWRRRTTSITS